MTQSPEELAAHFHPDGPVAAAKRWLDLILGDGDLDVAWPLTDPEYRRIAAAAWVDANAQHPALAGEDRDTLIESLSVERPDHWLWPHFARTQLGGFMATWSYIDLEKWGWGSWPRPHSPGYEITAIFEAEGEPFIVAEDTLIHGLQLLMHHVPGAGWLMAGVVEPDAPRPKGG